MKKKQLRILLCMALVVSMVFCSACGNEVKGGKKASSGVTKLTLNEVAHSIFYAPMYVAIEEGYFSDEGIDLDLVTGFGTI